MTHRHRPITTSIVVALFLSAASFAACGDDTGDPVAGVAPDYSAADLEGLSFVPNDLPDMDYQPQRSGYGAFTSGGENREIAGRLEDLGLQDDYAAQFFATSRDSELGFVESVTLLFEDAHSADSAIDQVNDEYLDFLAPARHIEAPDLGENAFGIRGDFDGFPVYAFGWRTGDALQLLTAAPNGSDPGPGGAVELGKILAAKADTGDA